MSLEKTTFVATSSNGRVSFHQTSAGLELQFVNAENNVLDTAVLSEDDLRSLLKDYFPKKRKQREAKTPANGSARKQKGAGASA